MISLVPTWSPRDVLIEDLLLVLALCGAKSKLNEKAAQAMAAIDGGGRAGDGEWTTDHAGRRTMQIRSMDTLTRVLGGQA